MSLLAYCIFSPSDAPDIPPHGVGGASLQVLGFGHLQCLVSLYTSGGPAKDSAISFHEVLQSVFSRTAIIPFRFPTVVHDEAELGEFIAKHAAEYGEALHRLRDMVQMEIRIVLEGERWPSVTKAASGAEYLRRKLETGAVVRAAAESIKLVAQDSAPDWRERTSAQGTRLFALVRRSSVDEFCRSLGGLSLPAQVKLRISGPWPASEFLAKNDE